MYYMVPVARIMISTSSTSTTSHTTIELDKSMVDACVGSYRGSQVAERLGSRASNQKVNGSNQAVTNDVVSLGVSPYLPRGECRCTYCKSLWIRVSAK